MGKPFARVSMVMDAIAAIMGGLGASASKTDRVLAQAGALKEAQAYESRGHGGKTPVRRNGALGVQRAARKAKGRMQNRRNHR